MNNERKVKVKIHYFRVGAALFLLILAVFGVSVCAKKFIGNAKETRKKGDVSAELQITEEEIQEPIDLKIPTVFYPVLTDNTAEFYPELQQTSEAATENSSQAQIALTTDANGNPVETERPNNSLYAIIVDTEKNEIVAQHNYNAKMYPASLTKIMTLIVVMDYVHSMDYDSEIDPLSHCVTITEDMINPMIDAQASRAGFAVGETPTVRDLIYGLILPSGADAAEALAQYVAGSESAFVQLMNEKANEMGLKCTHFANPVGLHDEQNYSTAEDMALVLEYALQDDFSKCVLSTYQYTVPPTEQNPEGILLTSTMLSRMTGDEMPGVAIRGGKTGFTNEAGQCLASFAEINGKTYVMVLAGGLSKWKTVYETLSGYSVFCYGGQAYVPPM